MSGLLSGLEQFGLSGLENMDLYEKPKQEEEAKAEVEQVVQEQDFLFDKTFTCPICDKEFKTRTVKIGKAKLIGTDMDLRPKYEHVDLLKYDIIMCPSCGYAALSRYFKFITSPQAKRIKEAISSKFKPINEYKEIYTYDEALERYKLTLANAIVKIAKPSEKAYICLKTAWLLRGKGEALDKEAPNYAEVKKKTDAEEAEFLRNALDGFLAARQAENFPMCGMDEPTVDYLISVIAIKFEQFDVASKLISQIIASQTTNPRMKEKARTLKDQIVKQIKLKNAGK
ncbi:hypothetical protein EDD76_10275 [Kineothrix alysoides]|uniref:DUF2225 domain-containing protein n=1 Tax=Kineothrix alysoides TaxID=1469948 RepID=A0A4R1R4P4_9FIRM|nr:DUF2225 domain-containing protein [Kineothrix alysoides]TCL60380.1 hypothetical protein EDD76_10275 [Kineothrix alysoides]